jgi:hypothetical protein
MRRTRIRRVACEGICTIECRRVHECENPHYRGVAFFISLETARSSEMPASRRRLSVPVKPKNRRVRRATAAALRNSLLGYKGTALVEPSYFYAPYVPIYSTPTVSPNTFYAKYAKYRNAPSASFYTKLNLNQPAVVTPFYIYDGYRVYRLKNGRVGRSALRLTRQGKCKIKAAIAKWITDNGW